MQRFTLHGPGWRVSMWEVALDAWAAGSVLAPALVVVLNRLNDHAGRVSWIGDGFLFCDPPELFSPSCMSGGVLLAVDDEGRVYGHFDPDEPIQPVDDPTMLELRRSPSGRPTSTRRNDPVADGGTALIEHVDRWILPLHGRVVVEVLLEYTVLLRFDDRSVVVIEAPFVLRKDGQEHLVDPEGDVIELIRLRPFADAVVAEATAFKTGALRLDLLDGTVVEVSVLDAYEPWTFSGWNNLLVVAMPGGELAIWPASVGVTHDDEP